MRTRAFLSRIRPLLLLTSLMLLLARTLAGQEHPAATSEKAAGTFSYIGQAVINTLSTSHSGQSTWGFATTSALPTPKPNGISTSWLAQTPPEAHWGQPASFLAQPDPGTPGVNQDPRLLRKICTSSSQCANHAVCTKVDASVIKPNGAATMMCLGHSDYLWNEMYDLIVQAKHYVDITSLCPFDGPFDGALRNAIQYLAAKKPSGQFVMRLRYGSPPTGCLAMKNILAGITLPSNMIIRQQADPLRSSWNHSKIIAVDEKEAIVGGHEKLPVYLADNPVHDLSMHVQGPVVAALHVFANQLWLDVPSLPAYQLPASMPAPGSIPVISVGRLGQGLDNASDDALYAMIDAAQSSILISQQDIVGPAGAPNDLLWHLVEAFARQVDVYIVTSNRGAQGDWGTSDPETTLDAIDLVMFEHRDAFPPGTTDADLRALLCRKLHLAPIRYSSEDIWPGASTPIPNHAKFMMVDDQAFYVGSHNFYRSNLFVGGADYALSEAGLIVDDAASANYVFTHYWSPLWNNSRRAAVSGPEIAACAPAPPTPVTVSYFSGTFNNQPGYFGFLATPDFVLRPEPDIAPSRRYDIEYSAGSSAFTVNSFCQVKADGTCTMGVTSNLPTAASGGWQWRVRRHDTGSAAGPWSAYSAFTPSLGSAAGIYGPPASAPPFNLTRLFILNFMVPPNWETGYTAFQPYLKWTDAGGRICLRRVIWRSASFYANGNFVSADGQFHVYQLAPDAGAFTCAADFQAGPVVMELGMGPIGCLDAGPCKPVPGTPSLRVTLTHSP
jgi:hypothetical protein